MPVSSQPPFRRWEGISWISAFAAGTALLAGHFAPDGRTHGNLPQFLGRFHPLIVHLPIGLVLLVPLLELAGAWGRRPDLRATAAWVLNLGAILAAVAAFDGWLLAWSGGYSGPLVRSHMWNGIEFAYLCAGAAWLRSLPEPARGGSWLARYRYPFVLGVSILMLCWASHEGGEITHGGSYLTEYMPTGLKAVLGMKEEAKPAPPAAPAKAAATFYAAKIDPIFRRSCVSCHNPNKVKGGLRMDTYAELMKGGKGGEEIEPWHPADSELVRRITLPADDDDHMPSNGKNPLSADEIALIERWIAAGATDTQPAVPAPLQ